LAEAVGDEYRAVVEAARQAREEPPGRRRRTLSRLRRELGRIRRRDYFPPPEREQAHAGVEALSETLEETPA
jgi:hypothetical protein